MAPRSEEQFQEIRERSREKIVAAALELFANNGFHSTSISQVAKVAGVSKGLIYNYFESKDDLLKGVFEQGLKVADDIMHLDEGAEPRARFKHMLELAFTYIQQNKSYYQLVMTLVLHPEEIASIKPFLDGWAASKVGHYTQLFEEMGYDNAYEEAMYCGAVLDGIMIGWFTMGDNYPLEAMQQRVIAQYCETKNEG